MNTNSLEQRLEAYSRLHPQEVLVVSVEIEGKEDLITVFKGFSSSLMYPTAFDPDVPILPDSAIVLRVDRVASPYNPEHPVYIEENVSLEQFRKD